MTLVRFLIVSIAWCVCAGESTGFDGELEFARDIRPILSNKCFPCHGPDKNARVGGFRLDQKSSVFSEADSGAVPVVAGDVSQSEIVRRVLLVGDEQMPPPDSELSLTETEKELIKHWINDGAPWQEHWAFQRPVKATVPSSEGNRWPRNEIDELVLANLVANGKSPNVQAGKETMIRRLSFDLTGLPPSLEEVDQFRSDDSELAYEHLVDRLLESPHFGEHFASYWLDAARFADTNGYQNDFKRSMWIWRDWVIKAFNRNLPFDQFVIEQVAGDLLPDSTLEQKIATGFNRNHRTVTEGGSIEEEWHVENLVDRVETTSTVFLGLTIGCARCHDHKFDPISQREFYQFYAFFNSIDEQGFHNEVRGNVPPLVSVPTDEYLERVARIESEIVVAKQDAERLRAKFSRSTDEWLQEFQSDSSIPASSLPRPMISLLGIDGGELDRDSKQTELAGEQERIKQASRQLLTASSNVKIEHADSITGKSLVFEESGRRFNLENAFEFDGEKPFSISVWIKPNSDGAILSKMEGPQSYRGFDLLISPVGQLVVHLIHNWPTNAIKVTTTDDDITVGRWTRVAISYDGSKQAEGLRLYVNKRRVELDTNVDALDGKTLTEQPFVLGFREDTPKYNGLISNVKVFNTCCSDAEMELSYDNDLRLMLSKSGYLENQQKVEFNDLLLANQNVKYATAITVLDKLKKKKRAIEKTIPTVMIMAERDEPRSTYVLARGQYDKPIKDVEIEPGFPMVLPGIESTGNRLNRLDLAKWLTSPDNPLTARVAVNRFWNQLFGIGLHETTEDFGVQSPLPSNQQLLDWLAVDFIESGWNVKRLLRQIVSSSTYRQSSSAASEAYKQDPRNRMLARASRFRLPAEAVRDNALAISGLLVRKIGGRSIKPYQPDELWADLAGGAGEGAYEMDHDENLYRRSLYIYRKRTVPHPTMSTFDAPSREVCQVSRQRTNTPLQALALLNDPTYVEAARQLAVRTFELRQGLNDRIVCAFRLATARRPNDHELAILTDAFEKSLAKFSQNLDSTTIFNSIGETKVDASIDPVELAAFSIVASMILNLDETITRE